MSPLLSHALCQTLLHHGSGEDAVTQLRVSRQEFKDAYYAVEKQIPGITLDFEKLTTNDPIESDPLIAQGNLSLLRLDDLYRETFKAWPSYSQGQELSSNKRTIKPESFEHRTDRSEKTEIVTKQTTPDATLINQAVNIVLASFRIQATLTHRREQLKNGNANNDNLPVGQAPPDEQPKTASIQENSRESASGGGGELPPKNPSSTIDSPGNSPPEHKTPNSQPTASARNAFEDQEDLIDHTESLNEAFDDFLEQPEKPIQKLRGLNAYTKLNGYKSLDPQEPIETCQHSDTPAPSPSPPPDPCESVSIRGSESQPAASARAHDQIIPEPYIELPPYTEISFQPPEIQEFLASLKEQPAYTNTS